MSERFWRKMHMTCWFWRFMGMEIKPDDYWAMQVKHYDEELSA